MAYSRRRSRREDDDPDDVAELRRGREAPVRTLLRAGLLAALWALPAGAAGPAPAPARVEIPAAPPTAATMAYDLVVLRPLGLVQTVVGGAFFTVFYPVSLVTGGSDHVIDYCVKSPFEQTFQRPLGAL
jgi:hypothetical protein